MSGEAKIEKEKELSSQFVSILTGKPYQPAIIHTNTVDIPVAIINPTLGSAQQFLPSVSTVPIPAPTPAASPVPPGSPTSEQMVIRLQ